MKNVMLAYNNATRPQTISVYIGDIVKLYMLLPSVPQTVEWQPTSFLSVSNQAIDGREISAVVTIGANSETNTVAVETQAIGVLVTFPDATQRTFIYYVQLNGGTF